MDSALIKPYFNDAEWTALPIALQSSFLELVHAAINTTLLDRASAVLRWLTPEWKSVAARLYLGANNLPQICWINSENREVEIQVMPDRIIWYVDGYTDSVEHL